MTEYAAADVSQAQIDRARQKDAERVTAEMVRRAMVAGCGYDREAMAAHLSAALRQSSAPSGGEREAAIIGAVWRAPMVLDRSDPYDTPCRALRRGIAAAVAALLPAPDAGA